MAVVTTNLGPVTAYGDAVRGGYTGTKEQWEALMADYGTIGTQAQADAQTASTAAQTATTKASEASASATQAQQAAASVSTPDTTLTQSGKAADAKATGDEISSLKEDLNAVFVTDTASGSVAHFVDGADGVPMKSVKVNIEPIQSGSGDPSPSNVRPITGYDSVKVYHSGADTADATEYDISLTSAGTVYGGTLDVVSGELTVDRAIVDLGSLSWGYSAPRFYSGSVTDGITPSDTGDLNAICEKYALYVTGALANQPDLSIFVNSSKMSAGTKRIVIRDSNYTDANSLKSSLNGVHLVYTLAIPLTYQLSATEVKSLLGINNVWSDAGDMDVEYRADTKLYIDKKLGV